MGDRRLLLASDSAAFGAAVQVVAGPLIRLRASMGEASLQVGGDRHGVNFAAVMFRLHLIKRRSYHMSSFLPNRLDDRIQRRSYPMSSFGGDRHGVTFAVRNALPGSLGGDRHGVNSAVLEFKPL